MKISINKSYVNRGNLIFTGISLMIIGAIILYGKTNFLNIIIKAIAIALIINGTSQIISRFVKRKDNISQNVTIGQSMLNLILGFGIFYLKNISLSLLPIVFALYLILNGTVKLISIYIYAKNQINIKLGLIIECIVYFGFGITSLFSPLMHLDTVLVIIAIYFILFGINFIKDFIREILPVNTKTKLKRKIRITLPVFLVALIPHKVLKKVNEYFEVNNNVVDENDKKNEEDIDLEVFIHVTPNGVGVVGHVDLYYNGEIISYGNYDESSYKLFGIVGKGTLFSCDKSKYINFCTSYSKKTLFSYGLKLNDEQRKNIENKIKEIKSNLVEWEPPVVLADDEHNIDDYKDYASMLYKSTGAKFFNFKSGKFKTYFGLNTNCVLLADSVIGNSGTDILGIGGIITPGTYYEYLKREFSKRNSIVVSRNIYKQK
ncbi:DUF308 domain-containing protein [Romboutsia lituseburensis]|uniref:DUF308 domain-containing protein n=1 Tax=Romboutsia lituseburensis TaxID=1537 RepID=UPI00215B4354|nr:DUF308 domain-containing protein [Romboutsia lituseburensis]MCR8743727.1 DUF308 domain-containing protein [Romboutsia lituseburensis]